MAGIEGFVGLEEQRKSVLADLRRTYSRDTTVSGEASSGSDNSCTSFATTHSPHVVGVRIFFSYLGDRVCSNFSGAGKFFLAYRIRISTFFTWTYKSYLTHVISPRAG